MKAIICDWCKTNIDLFVAALSTNGRLIYLSETGVWLPHSAFTARGTTHRVRVFRYEKSARGVAEDWAAKAVGTEVCVQAVR